MNVRDLKDDVAALRHEMDAQFSELFKDNARQLHAIDEARKDILNPGKRSGKTAVALEKEIQMLRVQSMDVKEHDRKAIEVGKMVSAVEKVTQSIENDARSLGEMPEGKMRTKLAKKLEASKAVAKAKFDRASELIDTQELLTMFNDRLDLVCARLKAQYVEVAAVAAEEVAVAAEQKKLRLQQKKSPHDLSQDLPLIACTKHRACTKDSAIRLSLL